MYHYSIVTMRTFACKQISIAMNPAVLLHAPNDSVRILQRVEKAPRFLVVLDSKSTALDNQQITFTRGDENQRVPVRCYGFALSGHDSRSGGMVDAAVSKTVEGQLSCRFESDLRHQLWRRRGRYNQLADFPESSF